MDDNVTAVDKIFANDSYFSNLNIAIDTFGMEGAAKIVMLRLGILGTIKIRKGAQEFTLTRKNFQEFWGDEASGTNPNQDKLKIVDNQIHFDYKGRDVVFNTDPNSRRITHQTLCLINEQFFSEQYNFSEIKNRDVIDIGANIGDSPIYFALNGAKKVYAYEPFPYAYNMAKKNIKANNLQGKIVLLNQGVGEKESNIYFEKEYVSDGGASITAETGKTGKGPNHSVKVGITTLKSMVEKYNISGALLKSDCEGAEYGILLFAEDKTLRAFDEIILEYHMGYLNIKKRLEQAGFVVEITKPVKMLHADGSPYTYAGLLKARQRR
jgi:FkbM family methyltransferase